MQSIVRPIGTFAGGAVSRRTRYALVGGVLGLGAPAGLLVVRMLKHGVPARLGIQEIRANLESYVYTATSTPVVLAVFGAMLGHYADRLAHFATTDPLTGLLNARVFHERLRQELRRAARYQEPLSLLIVDVDGLKRINDHYGHEAGDAALRTVAAAIRRSLREIDLGARLGGDEFGVLAPRTNEESAAVLAERLRACVAKDGQDRRGRGATISIGITSDVPDSNDSLAIRSLMTAADEALYRAKRNGGDRVAGNQQPVRPNRLDHHGPRLVARSNAMVRRQ
jgi:diguanylate cyclase (GGDEF)-like protein